MFECICICSNTLKDRRPNDFCYMPTMAFKFQDLMRSLSCETQLYASIKLPRWQWQNLFATLESSRIQSLPILQSGSDTRLFVILLLFFFKSRNLEPIQFIKHCGRQSPWGLTSMRSLQILLQHIHLAHEFVP